MIKACRDCRYVGEQNVGYVRCEHPKSFKELPNYYSGLTRTVARSIDSMRTLGECEHDARLFERRLDLVEG